MKYREAGAKSLAFFLMIAAFGSAFAQELGSSDFLSDYSHLKQSSDLYMDYAYLAPGAENMANYSAVMIDQPEIFIAPKSKYKGMKPDDMKQLADDLEASISATNRQADKMSKNATQGVMILESLVDCQLPENAQSDFANGLYHLGKITPVHLVRSTIDELRSTGKLAIIGNVQLRLQISETVQLIEETRDILNDIQGRLAPQVNYVDSQVAYRITGPIGGGSDIEFSDIDMDFKALCEDRRFYTATAAANNYMWDVIAANKKMSLLLQGLLTNVQQEISNLSGDSS